MKKTPKGMWPFLLVDVAAFYGLPLLIRDTGTAMLMLLAVMPLVCFAASLAYGLRKTFSFLYPLAVAALFTPTVFIFYNASAWVYIVGYGLVALVGGMMGKGLSSAGKAARQDG